jgi:hypothetical protein
MGKQRFPRPPHGGEARRIPARTGPRRFDPDRRRPGPVRPAWPGRARRLALLAAAAIAVLSAQCLLGQSTETNPPVQESVAGTETRELAQFFKTCFAQWHHGGDGVLSLEEVNAAIENPQARGNEAAAAVLIRWMMNGGARDGAGGMSLEQLQGLAADPRARRRFFQIRNHIWNVNRTVGRTLFLGRDPNFLSFHQGKMQDCYFLAVVGAMVCRDAQRVRSMIWAGGTGYRVSFPSGRVVSVPFLTDAEMVMGASVGSDHGIWLSVLEKAYGLLRKERWESRQRENAGAGGGGSASAHPGTIADIMGHGGSSAPVIALFTGHRVTTARLDQWLREDSRDATNKLDQLLVELARAKPLMTISGAGHNASAPVPKGIIRDHVFGLLGYRVTEKRAILFNPWGNHFDPDGTPGLVNGYITRNGVFELPLQDLLQIFSHLDYETQEML